MMAETVLLTGASGFVGSALYPTLMATGARIRCFTRSAARAMERHPDRDWVEGSLSNRDSVERALEGCTSAYFLVHGMGGKSNDYHDEEQRQAEQFAEMAATTGVQRIVYLGGLESAGPPSVHLASRLGVGRTLRAGTVPCLELRAGMIVGRGSLSWMIVRDLAARLPVMVLPRWMQSRMEPVSIDDVVWALVRGLDASIDAREPYDLPGPEVLTGREIINRTAAVLGLKSPHVIAVPFLTPHLSSLWLKLVTRANWSIAKELVNGMKYDLLARDSRYWPMVGRSPVSFDRAARLAVDSERPGDLTAMEQRIERMIRRLHAAHNPVSA